MKQMTNQRTHPHIGNILYIPKRYDILTYLAVFMCQRAVFFGNAPFGCAVIGALCSSPGGYLALPALFLGTLATGADSIKYLLSALTLMLLKTILPQYKDKLIFSALFSFLAILPGGIYSMLKSEMYLYTVILLLAEGLVCALAVPVFSNLTKLFDKNEKNAPISGEEAVSLSAMLAIGFWGLSGIVLPFSLSVKNVAAIYLLLCVSYYAALPVSALVGVILGAFCSVGTLNLFTLPAIFAFCSIGSGLLKSFGRFTSATGFLAAIMLCVLISGNLSDIVLSLSDIVVSSLLFTLLPSKFHQRTGIFLANTFKSKPERRDFRIKEYITEELNSVSNTFSEFARQFKSAVNTDISLQNDPARIFDEVCDRLCSVCFKNRECWQRCFNDTYKYMFSILDIIETTGSCDIDHAPLVFVQRCVQPELFLNEFAHVFEAVKQERISCGEQKCERSFVSGQYKEISEIIDELSTEIKESFYFDEQKEREISNACAKKSLYVRDLNAVKNSDGYYNVFFAPTSENDEEEIIQTVSEVLEMNMEKENTKTSSVIKLSPGCSYEVDANVCCVPREGETVCGDSVVHFKTDKNKYYIILCDGMGSGNEAYEESRMTAELLGGFLKAGFSKKAAVSLVNSTIALKMQREGFSTIDLCEIDLRSGHCEILKTGGAQSYIKHGDEIITISASGLPAGIIEDVQGESTKIQLYSGDRIIMLSDGITEAGYGKIRNEWIKKLIKADTLSVEELTKNLINGARKKIYPRPGDDMSVITIKLNKIDTEELPDEEAPV